MSRQNRFIHRMARLRILFPTNPRVNKQHEILIKKDLAHRFIGERGLFSKKS